MTLQSILKELDGKNIYWTLIFTFLTQEGAAVGVDVVLGQVVEEREQIGNNVIVAMTNKWVVCVFYSHIS